VGIRWRVEGTDGLARGTIGWPSYPARTPSTLDYSTRQQPNTWIEPRWGEVWFPDAFVGTMAQLLCAVEDGTEPEISRRDNLGPLALCGAVVAAGTHHRVPTVAESPGEPRPGLKAQGWETKPPARGAAISFHVSRWRGGRGGETRSPAF